MEISNITGAILGTAIGDAIGLPYEGLSRRRGAKLLGIPDRHRLLWGYGMVSDDTEHTWMVARAVIAAGGDVAVFQRSLAWQLRWWLLGVPAGIGLATLRSIVRLWLGFHPDRSGVFSAGNGAAMRSAILGVAISEPQQLRQFVRVTARITHTDPKAEYGAMAIAVAARYACDECNIHGDRYLGLLTEYLGKEARELLELIDRVIKSVAQGESTIEFAAAIGLKSGVSGYVYHSVPIAIHAWLSHPHDYQSAIMSAVACGGDTDSVAAMIGGIVGAAVGKSGIPQEWLARLWEPGRSIGWMERLSVQLALSGRQEVQEQGTESTPDRRHLKNRVRYSLTQKPKNDAGIISQVSSWKIDPC